MKTGHGITCNMSSESLSNPCGFVADPNARAITIGRFAREAFGQQESGAERKQQAT